MTQANLKSLIENLDSQLIEQQIPAIEETADIIDILAKKAVAALEHSSNRFLVAERLNCFGSVIIPHLEELLHSSTDTEVKILASLVLLQLDSKTGVSILLSAIKDSEEYAILAAQHLASAEIKDAIEPICDRLRSSDLEEIDLIVSLLDSLDRLDTKLPQDLLQRFRSDNVSWQIKTQLEEQCLSAKF